MNSYKSTSLDDLHEIASKFLLKYPTPGIFLIRGEMGAGKTTFVRAVCELMGAGAANSPTFSLVNEYSRSDGRSVYHLDLYRVHNLPEALDFGIEEYLASESYTFIEWPDIIMPLLSEDFNEIKILDNRGIRTISF